MSENLQHKNGTGISMQQFMDTMEKNKDAFEDWYQRFSFENEEIEQELKSLAKEHQVRTFLLAAEWCGDVVLNVPVLFKVLEDTEIPTEVLVMEDHLETMDQYLTMGGRAIPVLIFTNPAGDVLGTWGPRPAHVQEIMIAFKLANPDREAADYQDNIMVARKEMVARYGETTDYQHVIVRELRDLLTSFGK
ncbi:thioredoxin family protein [Brevibacillus daliensis]|uniref:thioredoxin family protein n=1 Tax=Brevibacillus daliensis TaxID=2892995 RepID=UPI001E44447A|nr:thioredoxin family protein [Brevibacillus daliensis]